MSLEPPEQDPAAAAARAEYDMSGLVVFEKDDSQQLKVAFVVPGSPGKEHGVRKDDVIEKINGVPGKSWTLEEWRFINRREGQTYTLTIRRGQELFDRQITMRALI
jgi:C-terminal processing protease CtpA/Prc